MEKIQLKQTGLGDVIATYSDGNTETISIQRADDLLNAGIAEWAE